jgi:hypothetical protein
VPGADAHGDEKYLRAAESRLLKNAWLDFPTEAAEATHSDAIFVKLREAEVLIFTRDPTCARRRGTGHITNLDHEGV